MAKKSRTREARQRRQKQRRQNQRRLALLAIVLVAVVAVAVLFVSNQPVESYIPEELSKRFEGLERSFSPEGYPQLGDQDAPVTVEEFSSFACPGCQRFHKESLDEILERVLDGQVLYTYVPLQTGSIPNAQGASRAALCAGNQGYFWEMHDVLFDWQTRYGNTAFSQNRLLAGVEALGMNPNAFTSEISATLNEALDEDVAVTPTVHVNGVTIESDTVLSAATILQTVDDVTPDDWGLDDESASAEPDEPAASADSADEPEATEDALVTAPPEPEPEEAAALEPVESAAEDEAGTEDESALDEIEIEAESDESADESETSGG